MAITLNGSVSSTSSAANTNTLTVSHTVASGSNRVLYAMIHRTAGTPAAVTSCTYGGNALTQIDGGDFTGAGAANTCRVSVYRLVAPTVGTADLVMTLAANNDEIGLGGVCLDGVDQSDPDDTAATASNGTAGPPSVTVSSATDDLVMDAITVGDNDALTATGTQNFQLVVGAAVRYASQRKAGAASVTMDWTGNFFPWAAIGFNVNAAGAAAARTPTPLLLGVG